MGGVAAAKREWPGRKAGRGRIRPARPAARSEMVRILDLEEWRAAERLTYAALAARVGASTSMQARRWALGHERPSPEAMEAILRATDYRVGLYPMHRRQLAWRASEGRTPRLVRIAGP